jgi:hypothetical protein
MHIRSRILLGRPRAATATILIASVVFLFASTVGTFGQKRFARSYPAGKNVRLALMNRSGTVTVEGWDRTDVSISAELESPAANIAPQNQSGTVVINLVRDNQGRVEVGDVNFTVRVPYYAMVDIETRIGNVNVSNVRSGLVRAKISSEGDITLTNIGSSAVSAENVIGDIFFDGDILDGGIYRFSSMRGTISLRIPFNSSFKLVATAPSTRNISLGTFAGGMNTLGNGRRVVGNFGEGSAALSITNQQGSIKFFSR